MGKVATLNQPVVKEVHQEAYLLAPFLEKFRG